MKRILILCLIQLFVYQVDAIEITSKAEIDSLIAEDDAVVLEENVISKIKSKGRIDYSYSVKILIKNNKAERYGVVRLSESEYMEIDDIRGRVTDIFGNEIKKLKKQDIKESSLSPYAYYQNKKSKSFKLLHVKFPYIIEYSYKKEFKSLFFWPSWLPQSGVPALKSTYKLIMDQYYPFKTYSIALDIKPEKSVENGDSVFYWIAENIPARVDEDFLPPENELQMALLFAPEKFEIGGTIGSTNNWSELGKWSWELNKTQTVLSPEIKLEIEELVKNVSDPYEKIRILYHHLQSSTHYVAIEVDIGGWQPFPAEETYINKYGDCKDLSNLMVAMLDVIGIKAYTADALMRDDGVVISEFPSPRQFNHVIVFIPMEKDSLWLECTADYIDIYDMPYKIEGINALVIKDDGGELIRTPIAPSSKNKWISNTTAQILLNSKSIEVNTKLITTGNQKRWLRGLYEYADSEDEKIELQDMFSKYTPNLTINQYEFSNIEDNSLNLGVEFSGVYKKSFAKSGRRIFINPNFLNRKTSSNIPDEKVEDRRYPIHFNYPYEDIDSLEIIIPSGYQLEAAPEPLLIDNSFARYETKFEFVDQKLNYVRSFEYKTNHFEKALYGEFIDFLKTVIKNDDAKFVFKK